MKRQAARGLGWVLLVVGAWIADHRTTIGYLLLVLLALAVDLAVFWLALQSAKVGPV